MNKQQRFGLWLMMASLQLPIFLLSGKVSAFISMVLMFFGGVLWLTKTRLWGSGDD